MPFLGIIKSLHRIHISLLIVLPPESSHLSEWVERWHLPIGWWVEDTYPPWPIHLALWFQFSAYQSSPWGSSWIYRYSWRYYYQLRRVLYLVTPLRSWDLKLAPYPPSLWSLCCNPSWFGAGRIRFLFLPSWWEAPWWFDRLNSSTQQTPRSWWPFRITTWWNIATRISKLEFGSWRSTSIIVRDVGTGSTTSPRWCSKSPKSEPWINPSQHIWQVEIWFVVQHISNMWGTRWTLSTTSSMMDSGGWRSHYSPPSIPTSSQEWIPFWMSPTSRMCYLVPPGYASRTLNVAGAPWSNTEGSNSYYQV